MKGKWLYYQIASWFDGAVALVFFMAAAERWIGIEGWIFGGLCVVSCHIFSYRADEIEKGGI